MPVDTKLNNLVMNKLTTAQYEQLVENGQVNDNELYLTTDANYPTQQDMETALATKQDVLTAGSGISISNNVISADISTVNWSDINDKPTFADVATSGNYNDLVNKPVNVSEFTNDANYVTESQLETKQDTLVSGTNIKTINNQSLLGSGNIDIQGGGSSTAEEIVNANEATGVISPLKVWQGTEQEWTNGKGIDWYNWRTNAAFGVKQTNNFSSVQDLTSIISDQNIYIGYKYNTTSYIYSTDGVNWSSGTFPSPVGYCLCVDNGFIFTNNSDDSKIMFSSDGINWTEVTLVSATWDACAYGNGTYVLVSTRQGVPNVAVSQNGVDWTIKTLYSSSVGSLTGIAFGNGTFVVVRGISSEQQLYYSEDNGSTWKTDYNINPSYQMGYPVFSKGKFIVTGYNSDKAAYSADGKIWTTVNLPSSESWYLNRSTENAFFIWAPNTTSAAYSTDGITWNAVNLPIVPSAYFPFSCFNKFIFKNGKDLYYSSDGNNWASLDLGSNFASSTNIFNTCKKGMITASKTTTDYATLGDIFNQVYTLDTTPTTVSTVYSEPNTASALTITSVGTGTITLSDNNTYTYTNSGDVVTYQTIGDAYPNYLANINGIGVKIGNTLIADKTTLDTVPKQGSTNAITSGAVYEVLGNLETALYNFNSGTSK